MSIIIENLRKELSIKNFANSFKIKIHIKNWKKNLRQKINTDEN